MGVPATQEAEAVGSLEPGRLRLQCARIVPLSSNLGNRGKKCVVDEFSWSEYTRVSIAHLKKENLINKYCAVIIQLKIKKNEAILHIDTYIYVRSIFLKKQENNTKFRLVVACWYLQRRNTVIYATLFTVSCYSVGW